MTSTSLTHRRRGMLLLMVMLMLALFMSIGAMLLTIAARARAAARANFAATQESTSSDATLHNALDEALMAALRGATTGTAGSVLSSGTVVENILADKYGESRTTTGTNLVVSATTPLITINITSIPSWGASPNRPSRLNGRVLTVKPELADGDISSFRILNAIDNGGGGAVCYLANMPTTKASRLPPQNKSYPVIINGREFTPSGGGTPEAYDAFPPETGPASDNYLAQPVLSNTCQVIGYSYLSFVGPSGITATNSPVVDNDNDGVLDGVWFPATVPSGTAPTPAPLVLPDQPSPSGGTLRFQVSYLILDLDGRINVNAAGIASGTGATTYPSGPGADDVGLGMGYGTADVDASLLFRVPPALPPTNGLTPFISTGTTAAPIWGSLVFGGTSALTSTLPLPNEAQRRMPPLVGVISGRYGGDGFPGTASDDTGGYQTTASTLYTTLVGGTNALADLQGRAKVFMVGSATTPTLTFFHPSPSSDAVNDPYELRLDEEAPRSASIRVAGSPDAVFTAAELERVLRANDPDAVQLPQRLAAVTSDLAQRSRMTITTDSWDTPGLTGITAQTIETFVANHPTLTLTSWTSGSNSTSINSVSPDTAAGLRFNINRPVDSMNEAEREEYCKGLFTLAVALGASGTQAAQWAANTLDFRDEDAVMTSFRYDSTPGDGWQLNSPPQQVWGIERPELVIRSVTEDAASGDLTVIVARPWRQLAPATKEAIDPTLGNAPNDLLLRQTPPIWQLALIKSGSQTASTDLADGSVLAPGVPKTVTPTNFNAKDPGSYKVVLKRLVNPAAPPSAANTYAVVDELQKVGNAWPPNPTAAWTHWPNRPFISHAELALVPAGFASSGPDSSLAVTFPQILDAVYVPSRFAGNAVNIPGTTLQDLGLDKLKFNHLSKWREPGKVNVNTIASGTNPGIDENDVIWTALTGSPAMNNPFGPIPRTPTQPANPGPPGNGATPATPRQPGEPARPVTSIAQLLSLNSAPGMPPYKDASLPALQRTNPYLEYAKTIRLANTATIRSQVFAIWITVRVTDDSPNAPSPVTKRLFAIIDRSIPVGYSPNQDLNVRDTIRLKRYLD